MTIYIIKWAIALTSLYSLYGLFLRKETFHALNRGVLLAILGLSMVLPLCQLTANNSFSDAMQEIEQAVCGEAYTLRQKSFRISISIFTRSKTSYIFVGSAEIVTI